MSYFIGLDISKKWIDVCFLIEEEKSFKRFENKENGHNLLLEELADKKVTLIVCEPTGGYERIISQALWEKIYTVCLVNTIAFSNFAKSVHLAKTDRLDSYKLALYGQKMNPSPSQVRGDERIKDLVQRREDLSRMISDEKRRLEHTRMEALDDLKLHIKILERLIKRLNQKIYSLIAAQETLKRKADILKSTPGIGDCLAAKLLSHLPELGDKNFSFEKLTALVGIAPYSRDSGTKSSQRFIRGGRKIPRDALYMAVLTGKKSIPFLHNLYDRLIAKGKAKKIAIVACMRKLLSILHALLKQDRNFITNI